MDRMPGRVYLKKRSRNTSTLPLPPLDLIQQVSFYAEMVGLSIGEAWQRLQADSVLMAQFLESEALVYDPPAAGSAEEKPAPEAGSSSHWRTRGSPLKLNRAVLTGLHRSVVRVIAPRRRPASRASRARRPRSTRRARSPDRPRSPAPSDSLPTPACMGGIGACPPGHLDQPAVRRTVGRREAP